MVTSLEQQLQRMREESARMETANKVSVTNVRD